MENPKFQEYAHDKYFNTVQSDIEPTPEPGIHVLKSTETKKLKEKLEKILLNEMETS